MQTSGFIQYWNGTYLTSNTVWADTGQPVGSRYTYWKCRQPDAAILVFGFLFNDQIYCKNTRVETVQDTIRQPWFQNVLRQEAGSFQAIVVLAHMGYLDQLVHVLLQAMRDIVGPDMVIQFINGHTHERGFQVLDPRASAFEAGRFLDTVGLISFPLLYSDNSTAATTSSAFPQNASIFEPVFLDTNTQVLAQSLGVENLAKTPDGKDLSRFIDDTRVSMGLTRVVGCSNTTYFLTDGDTADHSSSSSLWGLYMNKVIPSVLLEYNSSKVFIQSTNAFRDNLWMGDVTIDDLIETSPFDDPIYNVVNQISGADLMDVLHVLGASNTNPALPNVPQIAVSSLELTSSSSPTQAAGGRERLLPRRLYDLYSDEYDTSFIAPVVATVTGRQNEAPVLYLQNENDKSTRLWTTGRVWREYVAKEWPCPVTTSPDPFVQASFGKNHPATIGFSLWKVLMSIGLVPFLAWAVYLVKFKRLSSSPQRPTLDSSSETTRLIDDEESPSNGVTSRAIYHST
jgi:hypothetical protein